MSCSNTCDCTETIELPWARSGDTWDGITEASLSSTGTQFADPLALVEMNFFVAGSTTSALTLSSADDEITIADAATWSYVVEPLTMTLAAGQYSWTLRFTDTADRAVTWLTGTIEIR
jgi:hypothetical protein